MLLGHGTSVMNRFWLVSLSFILALGTLPSLATGQTTAPAQPVSPQAPQTLGASSAPVLSSQMQSALKLAGLVTFVANSCPDLKPNYPRFKATLNALGASEADLNKLDLKGRYLGYTARYNADAKANCLRAKAQFGPGGSTLPDIFQVTSTTASPHQ